MKTVFPKNIQKGLLAGLTLTIGPISVSLVQIFILAIGVVVAFAIFNRFQSVSKAFWAIAAVVVFLIFVVIAFFKISELNLLAFLVKFVQSHFIDTSQKYQTNYLKPSRFHIMLEKVKISEWKPKIEYKTAISLDAVDKLDTSWLLS